MAKMLLKGETVTLTVKTATAPDAFGNMQYTESTVEVNNVLVGSPSANDIEMYGTGIEYVLGIPKGDTHDWEHTKVTFFGKTFKTLAVETGTSENIPLAWDKNVKVGRYEG